MDHRLIENASKLLQQNVHHGNSKQSSKLLVRQSTENSVDNLIFSGKRTGTLHDWISQVNANLSTSTSRLEGLVVLRAVIQQCSQQTFTECCITWVRLLINIFQPHQTPSIVEITSGLLVDILRTASRSNEITRDLAINHIPGLLGTLLNAEAEEWLVPSLRLLAVCMECFPGPCGAISYKLEAMIVPHLDSTYPDIQKLAQRCYPLLARLGGGGSGGVKYTDAFNHYSLTLLSTLQSCLSVLYADYFTDTEPTSVEGIEPISLTTAPVEEPMRTLHLTNQLESLSNCLQIMLRNEFPAKASVPVKFILEYVSNALEVTGKTLGDHVTSETSMLALVLPRIHQTTLRLLTALIKSCCINHYNHQINQICIKMLGWTHSQDQVKPFRNLRAEVYRTIVMWLKTAGASSGFAPLVGEKLIHQCIQDATPHTDTTKLSSGVQAKTDKKGGKVKVKGQTSHGTDLSRGQHTDQYFNRTLCLSALQALRQVLLTSGVKLKANLHQDIYKFAIPLLTNIQSCDPSSLPPPYTCCECRLELYGILQAGVLVPHPQATSPLNLAVAIFKEGKNDKSLEVSSACVEASIICEAIIHPRRPPVPRPKSKAPPTSLSLRTPSTLPHPGTQEGQEVTMESEDSISAIRGQKDTELSRGVLVTTSHHGIKETASVGHSGELLDEDSPHKSRASDSVEDGGRTDETKIPSDTPEDGASIGKEEEEEDGEEEEEDEDGSDEIEEMEAKKMEDSPGTSSRKRKHETSSSEQAKKPATEEMESMMSAFIDAPPDCD